MREAIRGVKLPAVLHVAKNGEEAIRFLDEADADITAPCPSVVLLDINLPRKPGSEILQHLRKSQRCGKAVVVVVSSSDSAKDREVMTKLGANAYFHKPFKYEEFMKLGDLVKDLLGGTGI